jgi:FAD:protein FMN transferase
MLKKGFFGLAWVVLVLFLQACIAEKPAAKVRLFVVTGSTMGTTYSIKYFAEEQWVGEEEIDELLIAYNEVVSTYLPQSLITRFNEGMDSLVMAWDQGGQIFFENLEISKDIFLRTGGIYDPTVLPLVNYYGFGSKGRTLPDVLDTLHIEEMLTYIGFDKVQYVQRGDSLVVRKDHPALQLDFSAVAKGHGVDTVAKYLEAKGIYEYMVEIGGEVRVGKKKPGDQLWSVGLSRPQEGAPVHDFISILQFSESAMATSGNYRNYRESAAGKLAHTLNPKTGFPQVNEMLSVTVIAQDCAIADAWATAFMALGKEGTEQILLNFEWEVLYIYTSQEEGDMATGMTPGFKDFIKD